MTDDRSYGLAASQHGFWALHEAHPGTPIGNEALVFRLRGALQRDALLASVADLARRWDVWHTAIRVDPGVTRAEPTAFARGADAFRVEELELSSSSEEARERALSAALRERLHARFELAGGALMRAALLRFAPDDHALLFVSNHVAFDGISFFRLLGRELAACYEARLRGETPALAPCPTYAEFARLQREACAAPDRPALAHWREVLRGAPAALDLATDHRRPAFRDWRGARTSLAFPAELRALLTQRAALAGVSLSDLLLGAFALLLRRYSGQEELVIGVPHGNRRDERFRDVFGCLMITAPVRCALHGESGLDALLRHVRAAKRDAFAHLDPGAEALLRDANGGAGYAAVFNYLDFSHREVRFAGLEVEVERPDPGWTGVDLSLDVAEEGGGLAATLEYATALFERETAERILRHYRVLLESIARSGADVAWRELEVLDAADRERWAELWSSTARRWPLDQSLVDVIRERVLARPDSLALSSGDLGISHRELLARAVRLAEQLRALGAEPGTRVALAFEDPIHWLVAMLGALEAGAAYVPIDPALPAERLAFMLEASRPVVVLTEPAVRARLPASSAPALCIDALPRGAGLTEAPLALAGPDDPAYVIFTSGSTGRPKGVVVRHRNLVNQLLARLESYPEPPRRLLTTHSFAFDAAVAGIYWTLATGGLLVLPGEDARRDPVALRRLVSIHAVTHLDIVPSLYTELLAGGRSEDLASLETVIVGGEACSAELARRHFQVLPNARLYNEYGPTETTVYSTVFEVPRGEVPDPVPIGRAVANTRCYVLDERRRLLPIGVPGELYIAGAGVAAGYLGETELTAERFVADPFAPGGGRMYRTGDLARLRADGGLDFLGRVDRQIKVRGHRVAIEEVEAALLRQPGVARAVAVGRNDATGGHIDAWIVPGEGAAPSLDALRAALREALPSYMQPAHLALLEQVPLTPAGKVDVDALPRASGQVAESHAHAAARIEPRTQTEQLIAQIWTAHLELGEVGVTDDFFELGGHSLLAVRMLSELGARLGLQVPLASFASRPTIAALAGRLHDEGALGEESLVVTIQKGGERTPFWLLHPVGGHIVFARRLARHLDADQPLLGLQAQGLDGRREPLWSIEEMADRYLAEIRATQPSEPYYLGGHSLGGLIALEMAQRLVSQGVRVGMVALFDAPGPGYPRRVSLPLRLLDFLRLSFNFRRRGSERALPRDGMTEYLSYDPFVAEIARGYIVDAIEQVTRANASAADRYVPKPYPGTLHVFRATQTPDWPGLRFDDDACGWRACGRQVETVQIDCAHHNMLDEPAVTELGKKLQEKLTELQRREPA